MFKFFRLSLLSLLVGGVSSYVVHFFFTWLNHVTMLRLAHPQFVWLLPFAGLGLGLLYKVFGDSWQKAHGLILQEIHNPQKHLPLMVAPLVLLSTLLTHLVGGSAGREGTAVQMSAGLADNLARIFNLSSEERKGLMVAGLGAGFGSALGAPWAGLIFGMECLNVGRLKRTAIYECALASFAAGYAVEHFWPIQHIHWSPVQAPYFHFSLLWKLIFFGASCGLLAWCFAKIVHGVGHLFERYIQSPAFRPFWGGLLLLVAFQIPALQEYQGLGLNTIQDAFVHKASVLDPIFKTLLTAVTLGSGFKGGEFIPLVYLGATWGSVSANVFHLPLGFLASLGFVAVFAGASNAPITCFVMSCELFGFSMGLWALPVCLISYYFSGNVGIYPGQKLDFLKEKPWLWIFRFFGELPKRFL